MRSFFSASAVLALTISFSHLMPTLAAPTKGCSSPPSFYSGTRTVTTIESGARNRSYIINIPVSYGNFQYEGVGAPLIIGFHGATRTSAFFETQSQYANATLNSEYVTVFPQGVNDYWEGSPYADPSVNDILFVNDLLNALSTQYCLDDSRFFASGHSNGGGFTNTIACWPGLSGRFAAFAPMSAAVYNGTQGPHGICQPDHEITPVMEMHGLMDPTIPYKGGPAQGPDTVPPVLTWLKAWIVRNGCADGAFPHTTLYNGHVQHYENAQCEVQHYSFQYMPHAWPSNTTTVFPGDFNTPMEGMATILQWFSQF